MSDFFDELMSELRGELAREESLVSAATGRIIAAAQELGAAKKAHLQHGFALRFGSKRPAPPSIDEAALALATAIEAVPEVLALLAPGRPAQAPSSAPTESVEDPPAAVPQVRTLTEAARALNPTPSPPAGRSSLWPALASASLPVVIVGGLPSPEKLAWVREGAPRTEWLELTKKQTSVQGILGRIHGRNFSSVLVLDGFVRSDHATQIRSAARAAGMPCATADTAGQGQLRTALDALDRLVREARS